MRTSVNAPGPIHFEGGTDPLAPRRRALGRLARDGYRVGRIIAPINPTQDPGLPFATRDRAILATHAREWPPYPPFGGAFLDERM